MTFFHFHLFTLSPFHLLVLAVIFLIVFVGPVALAVFLVVRAVRAKPVNGQNLHSCPNCGRMVSWSAPTCPLCGRPLQE